MHYSLSLSPSATLSFSRPFLFQNFTVAVVSQPNLVSPTAALEQAPTIVASPDRGLYFSPTDLTLSLSIALSCSLSPPCLSCLSARCRRYCHRVILALSFTYSISSISLISALYHALPSPPLRSATTTAADANNIDSPPCCNTSLSQSQFHSR